MEITPSYRSQTLAEGDQSSLYDTPFSMFRDSHSASGSARLRCRRGIVLVL